MLKKVLKTAAIGVVALIGLGLVLYAAGVRVELDGGGSPHLRVAESPESQARDGRRFSARSQSPGNGGIRFAAVRKRANERSE